MNRRYDFVPHSVRNAQILDQCDFCDLQAVCLAPITIYEKGGTTRTNDHELCVNHLTLADSFESPPTLYYVDSVESGIFGK